MALAGMYVWIKNGAEVLEIKSVRGYDYKLMAADFERQYASRSSLSKAVFMAS